MSYREISITQKRQLPKRTKIITKRSNEKNAPGDLKQKVLDGDITTHKEYKQLQKDKEELEQKTPNSNHK